LPELEGGEVGSGHSLMAVFEIEPIDAMYDSIMRNNTDVNIAQLQLHYRVPQRDRQIAINFPVPNNFEDFKTCDSSIRFATSVIMFGGLLKQSELWEYLTWDAILKIARNAAADNDFSQKEFITLVEKAKVIYEPYKKKKKKGQE